MEGTIFIVSMISIIIYFTFVAFNYYFDKKNKFTEFNLNFFKDRINFNDDDKRKKYMTFLGKHYFRFTLILSVFVMEGITLKIIIDNGILKEYIANSFEGVSKIEMTILIANIIIVIFIVGELLNLTKTKQKMIDSGEH